MRLLNIRHQKSELHCPWQNGRIERLFGTLKQKLDRISVSGIIDLNTALCEFRFWYNAVGPHQHLFGRTPAEVWAGRDVYADGCWRFVPLARSAQILTVCLTIMPLRS